MSLVKVTSKLRNDRVFEKDLLIEIEKLTEPVSENIHGDSVLVLDEASSLQGGVGSNIVQYIVDESLAQVIALNPKEIFAGTVVRREGREPLITNNAFIVKNIVGKIESDASGSKFFYEEHGGFSPVEYVISETIADINTALS